MDELPRGRTQVVLSLIGRGISWPGAPVEVVVERLFRLSEPTKG